MINAGKYNRRITIFCVEMVADEQGFQKPVEQAVLRPWAAVRTTKGMTLIINNSDFEKAYTNFTIRWPKIPINRDMFVRFGGKTYTIEYLNNVDEAEIELEMQCKEVTH